ncbi:lysoplasmalogenase [Legionella jordanis]|uniref:Transmembrane protein n=1 Tax=Legionella jordanis TaxID=456 RepID=A0A0W0VCD5_9GAMM|nr:lysoplasmalogenase [Legionella jordanis]KTD17797.1 transmembrane protein [Legionella jordanis]RMX02500.1 lysoplasmalogenase [Legionella jordanis]RMX21657.1 lysoplasmalogenase [Legionella jordanis]VEH11266.1 transmembrane protein [Legionella jordanis]
MLGKTSKIIIVLFLLTSLLYLSLLPFIQYPVTTVLKPMPIIFLIILVWQSMAKSSVRLLLYAALGCSLLGDVILTLPIRMALEGGILSFMLAHCAYIVLYYQDSRFQIKRLFYFSIVLLFIACSYWYLSFYLGNMLIPVSIYLLFLTLMVFSAFQVQQNAAFIIGGACIFLSSDFILALNQFVFLNHPLANFLVMLSYFMAQFLLVYGLSQRQHREESFQGSTDTPSL